MDPTYGVMGIQNCTVAFFAQCMSIAKCKSSCKSMGAAKYRWFHEYGCCQCIGSTCLDYGFSAPHCLNCPATVQPDVDLNTGSKDLIIDFEENVIDNDSDTKLDDGSDSIHQPLSGV